MLPIVPKLNIDNYLSNLVNKTYLVNNDYKIIERSADILKKVNLSTTIRLIHLTKFVYEKDISIIDKFTSVYSSLHSLEASVIIKLISDGKKCDIYYGIKKEDHAAKSLKVLKGAIEGNFPGTIFNYNEKEHQGLTTDEIEILQHNQFDKVTEISTVLGVPSLKDSEDENFIQGIENLIKGMQGKPFSALFIADPISSKENEVAKVFFENIYTELSCLKEQTFNIGKNESDAFTEGITETIGETIGLSTSESESTGTNKSSNRTENPWIGKSLWNKLKGYDSISKNDGSSETKSTTSGTNQSSNLNIADSFSKTKTTGMSSSIQYTRENKTIINILENLDLKFERLNKGENVGLWNVGIYFLSSESQNSIVAANIYNGIIKGENSRVEKSAIKTFLKNENALHFVSEYLKNYELPYIQINNSEFGNSLGTIVTSDELTVQLCPPQKSIIGLDVVEVAAFGNNLKNSNSESAITIGKLYNYEKEYDVDFDLDIEKLTGHLFVTGSTGSGKSNVTYQILNELIKKDIKFMVIEPAKGEYKDVFGHRKDVNVFSTNSNYSKLLKINPFSFPPKIHIYEHIDRFIEILNACWSMEAAMPAFLKEALILTYQKKGWDLDASKNLVQENCFPDFNDLLDILPKLIEASGYGQEMKNNYTGALVTRVKSMTNGLLRPVFCSVEIASKKLFDENTIIDLSRVASSETKSLLMGIVFMKLQEYRMSESTGFNCPLKHVAIIEEAHNLLKKTSSEQTQGSSNLQGKSVEMISNAIAEMRTYGQGFILADQAPGLLDPSAIRNTNTKICLRLPSQEDRELVGKAMNLNELQINELAKLKTGVGAVYQNDWQEAMLCKFSYFENKENNFKYLSHDKNLNNVKVFISKQLVTKRIGKELEVEKLDKLSKNSNLKAIIFAIKQNSLSENEIAKQLYELLEIEMLLNIINSNIDICIQEKWLGFFIKIMSKKWFPFDTTETLEIKNLILKHLANIDRATFANVYVLNRKKSQIDVFLIN
ncbi:DNA helicase HerA, contains HAS-barrel and ATPase domains [Flavobacterium micromati]|uniref:DNA helicase HerA, contains HAS-barrel and ATPase domains n=1 Tax=Flavobacterium micromati TaxID=229205 RepID=A0A1M5JXE6_9FLAO|nr:ATP-binding protein [Flavobacterium micromati]SHG44909.1 DNA helicase HerA, contains HAS-barrel and ATPase domains [Flavobacterium micromati]